jgi:hypothetical protein
MAFVVDDTNDTKSTNETKIGRFKHDFPFVFFVPFVIFVSVRITAAPTTGPVGIEYRRWEVFSAFPLDRRGRST